MLDAALQRILDVLPEEAVVLQVGGGDAPLARADWILDTTAYEDRGPNPDPGPQRERFGPRQWVLRDPCDRDPWPFRDGQFDFAICAGLLERVRDPIGVCAELARVARGGYVEVPTVESQLVPADDGPWLGDQRDRWFVQLRGATLVFTHRPPSLQHGWTLRVEPRWQARMAPEDHRQGLFWEGTLPARERVLLNGDHRAFRRELRERLVDRFGPSAAEQRVKQARDAATEGFVHARRPLRWATGGLRARLRWPFRRAAGAPAPVDAEPDDGASGADV